MVKKFTDDSVDEILAIHELTKKRDASIRRYEAIMRELSKHRADAEEFQREIDALVEGLATVAQDKVRSKQARKFPWDT